MIFFYFIVYALYKIRCHCKHHNLIICKLFAYVFLFYILFFITSRLFICLFLFFICYTSDAYHRVIALHFILFFIYHIIRSSVTKYCIEKNLYVCSKSETIIPILITNKPNKHTLHSNTMLLNRFDLLYSFISIVVRFIRFTLSNRIRSKCGLCIL